MDDIGNIIYLIVILLSFVFSIWQKANKKQQDESRIPPEIEDLFDDRDTEVWEEDRFTPPDPAAEQTASERLRQMAEEATAARAGRRAIRKEKQLQIEVDEAEASAAEIDHLDLSDFDARKAVIYSEILNPPYL